jgi:CRISPR system Cascade subunit CasB
MRVSRSYKEDKGDIMTEQKRHPFISSLEKLRDEKNRAALAKLRRGLGRKMGAPEMYPYVVPYLPDYPRGQENYFLIASLFAMHPESSHGSGTLGKVFRRILQESGGSDSVEKRFTTLLSGDLEDMGGHLRHAVSLARSRSVPIDYHRLLHDLEYWDHKDRFVQLEWARDFWGWGVQEPYKGIEKGEEK